MGRCGVGEEGRRGVKRRRRGKARWIELICAESSLGKIWTSPYKRHQEITPSKRTSPLEFIKKNFSSILNSKSSKEITYSYDKCKALKSVGKHGKFIVAHFLSHVSFSTPS